MKLFEKQDDRGTERKAKTAKIMRRFKNKRERAAARKDPEHVPTYKVNRGWVT